MASQIDLERTSGFPSEGLHLFKITKAEEKASKASNQPQYVLTLTCQDGGADDQGKTVTMFLSLSPQARFKIDQLLDAIEAPKHGVWTVDKFVGNTFKGLVVYGEYEGNMTANISKMLPASFNGRVESPRISTDQESTLPEQSSRRRIF